MNTEHGAADAAVSLIDALESLPGNYQRDDPKRALAKVQELRPLLVEYVEQNPEALGLIGGLWVANYYFRPENKHFWAGLVPMAVCCPSLKTRSSGKS